MRRVHSGQRARPGAAGCEEIREDTAGVVMDEAGPSRLAVGASTRLRAQTAPPSTARWLMACSPAGAKPAAPCPPAPDPAGKPPDQRAQNEDGVTSGPTEGSHQQEDVVGTAVLTPAFLSDFGHQGLSSPLRLVCSSIVSAFIPKPSTCQSVRPSQE
ncbi:hypothetical protein MG293_002315 [Ovis ammon polii]|uniref:Uncharacterized protein n=1 Tax=Ovis ammon polii TaxID=230172 RepID=A0AAD4UKM0_OVIAM|nr:hypothetical protein MG293_002315 [Ovis ammon polii]KAI4576023.1 hypothetical protein MJT46_001858 [Ovis ammon polii x Ovis aries]